MRTRTMIVAAGLLITLAAGCGGGEDATGGTSTTTVTTAIGPSPAQLDAMLLTADTIDLPGGRWTVRPLTAEGLTLQPCASEIGPAAAGRLDASTGIDAGRSDGNASLQERLIAGAPTQLAADLDAYRRLLATCPDAAASGTAPTPLALPDLGDQRWALTGPTPNWPSGSLTYLAYVRVGGVAVNLVVSEQPVTAGASRQISDAAFVALLSTAVHRIGG
jgi:hypothetical protein